LPEKKVYLPITTFFSPKAIFSYFGCLNQINMKYLTSLFLLFLLGMQPALAQDTLPVSAMQALEYRSVGPARGGRVTAVSGVPGQPYTYYMGATGGGVWKTTDGGLSWNNISDGYFKAGSIGAIAVAPSDDNVVYVGTGSADPRGNVSPGVGMYKSEDAGETWTFIGLPKAGQIAKIIIHPQDPEKILVAVLGNVFGPSKERGVYRSADGGNNWEKVLYVDERTGAIDLIMDAKNPRVLYAGFWTAERKPWTFIDGSESGGVYKSIDGGDNWQQVKNGLPGGVNGRIGLAISPVNPKRIWVFIENQEETKGGLYRSDDGGASFSRINRDHELRQRAWYYSRIFADPQDENTLYFMNVRMHKSIDGGKTFTTIRTPHGDNHALWINPENTQLMVQGNDGGANVTVNGGQTWTTQYNQPTSEFYRLTIDNQFPYRLYAAQQDNSTISVPSRAQSRISPEAEWFAVGGGESGHIAVDPRNPNLIYAGNYIGQITRLDREKGHSKDVVAYPQMHDGTAPRDIVYRFQWNAPIRISPHDPDVVYHCSQYVHRTEDGGRTWETISPDLTTDKDEYHNIPGEPVQHDHTGVELYTTIFAFEESPKVKGELWAGTDDGRLHLSRDNGESWKEITPKDLPVEGTINMIELSVHDPGRALIAVYKYRENDFRPYIFLTDNYGRSWKRLTDGENGIPADHFVRVVREDPIREGLLYAGTEFGMYISFNEGKQWQPFQQNLPIVPITDMQIKDNDLVLATQGRSFWIMDDLSPLREMDERLLAQEAHLFPPNTAYRTQLGNYYGVAAPDQAPSGALIHFYVNEPQKEAPISIEIVDPFGESRVTYSTKPDKDKKERKLTVKPGLNRLEWNLRYEAPKTQPGSRFSLANLSGVKATIGTHTVVMEVGEQRMQKTFEVKTDPRWTQTKEDLHAQHDLAVEVMTLLNTCHATIGEIRDLRSQIKDIQNRLSKTGTSSSAFTELSQSVLSDLEALEAELIQTKSESGQDPINYPPMLDDQIAYLYSIVNGQDDRPTEGAYQRYEDVKKAYEVHHQAFQQLCAEQLPKLNSQLNNAGFKVIGAEDR
jgi:photosystem II stability/assembly factor-like uncharacterized protein